jgi:hypothetical protein
LSTGAIGILGKRPRQQGAGVLFSNFRFFQPDARIWEKKHRSFIEAVAGAQIMLGYSHHEGARKA